MAEGHQFHNACLMADLVGSRVITEDELDSLTLKSSIEEILGMVFCLEYEGNILIIFAVGQKNNLIIILLSWFCYLSFCLDLNINDFDSERETLYVHDVTYNM